MVFTSETLEAVVNEFSKLPGIGKKTALRLALHLLKQNESDIKLFSEAIRKLKTNIRECEICHNITEEKICSICASTHRNHHLVCVVKDFQDFIAIENTAHFSGVYHVLGGLIQPMEGVGPSDIQIESLLQRVENGSVEEVILALSANIEGDTTTFYLAKKLSNFPVKLSKIARGIPVGSALEYNDELTISRALIMRTEI